MRVINHGSIIFQGSHKTWAAVFLYRTDRPDARWSWWWCRWWAGPPPPGTVGSLSSPGTNSVEYFHLSKKIFFSMMTKLSDFLKLVLKVFQHKYDWEKLKIIERTWTLSLYKSKNGKVPTQNQNSVVLSCWNIFVSGDQREKTTKQSH